MRIRKAEKLLGFTSELLTPPSMPWDSAADIVVAAGLLCEINRSSTLVDVSINLCSSNHQKEGSDAKEEKYKLEEKVKDKEEIKNEEEPSRKRREKEAEATGKMKCKKMNGKGTASSYCCYYSVLGIDSRECANGGNESSLLDEESDPEALADGLNGADEEEVEGGNLCNFNYKKKMRPLKKRGRKPMKARSLKSLLSFKVCSEHCSAD